MNKYKVTFTDGVIKYIYATNESEAQWKACQENCRPTSDISNIVYTV